MHVINAQREVSGEKKVKKAYYIKANNNTYDKLRDKENKVSSDIPKYP